MDIMDILDMDITDMVLVLTLDELSGVLENNLWYCSNKESFKNIEITPVLIILRNPYLLILQGAEVELSPLYNIDKYVIEGGQLQLRTL